MPISQASDYRARSILDIEKPSGPGLESGARKRTDRKRRPRSADDSSSALAECYYDSDAIYVWYRSE